MLRITTCVLSISLICLSLHAEEPEQGSLQKQLDEVAAGSAKRLPPELLKTFSSAIDIVRATGIEQSAKQVGDDTVDAELTGWNEKSVKLSELWSEGPVVLMWYRGGWCPYCNIQLRAMQKQLKNIENAGAKLVVLTPELPKNAKETAKANDVDFVVLHDKNNDLVRKYGVLFQLPESIAPLYANRLKLQERNGTEALSATYVINTHGKIRYAFIEADYKKRAEPSVVVDVVKQLAK